MKIVGSEAAKDILEKIRKICCRKKGRKMND